MTKLAFRIAAIFLGTLSFVRGEDASPKAAPSKTVADFSSFKTADDLWKQVEKLQQTPEKKPGSREEALRQVQDWLGNEQAAADAFSKSFPDDSRAWQARLISLRARTQLRRFSGGETDGTADQKQLDEIINAPTAPEPIKGEAAFMRVMTLAGKMDPTRPIATAPQFFKAAGEFLEKYPEHPLAARMRMIEVQVLNGDNSPEGEALLQKLASASDPELAGQAKAALARRQATAALRSKPVDLKFTSAEGHDIDVAQYRGKVVLVDFWASWCGPCMGEMPNVVRTYGKLHDKGFEILGISLDQDKSAMEGAMKSQKMTWPQYFDGQGWQNKISASFGIQSIPAAWLLDKKGMLRETGLRGEALESAVEKLLAE